MKPLRNDDFEALARRHLPAEVFDHFAAGSGDDATLHDNREAFARVRLLPRVLRDTAARRLDTTLLGAPVAMPVMVAPIGMLALVHDDGELAVARAAAAAGVVFHAPLLASVALEETARVAGALSWFQYCIGSDRGRARALAERAGEAGCRALVLSVDHAAARTCARALRNGLLQPSRPRLANLEADGIERDAAALADSLDDSSLDWNDLAHLCADTALPVVVKGILHPDDARLAVAHGARGVFVSNDGGRQVDGVPATLEVLAEVVEAVDGRAEVYLEGGVRSGSDVAKALGLGARAVAVGRPAVWALAARGERGVRALLTGLREELDAALAACGACSPGELGN